MKYDSIYPSTVTLLCPIVFTEACTTLATLPWCLSVGPKLESNLRASGLLGRDAYGDPCHTVPSSTTLDTHPHSINFVIWRIHFWSDRPLVHITPRDTVDTGEHEGSFNYSVNGDSFNGHINLYNCNYPFT